MRKSNFGKVAVMAALKAGTFIKKNTGKVKNVRYKGEINMVTDVDRAAEGIVVSTIRKAYPRHNFLAEEETYGEKGPGFTPPFHTKEKSIDAERAGFTWIIDPLDGTTNFLHGFPFFCVSIALAHQGKIVVGAVYAPARDELFYAEHGKGAFLNRKRIRVSKIRDIKRAMVATGFAYNIRRTRNNNIDNFVKFIKTAQSVRRAGSAALDLCYIACGRFDGFWELYLHPWDTAAAFLIVREAGGKVTKFDGTKFSIYGRETLASNSKIHSRMIKILSG